MSGRSLCALWVLGVSFLGGVQITVADPQAPPEVQQPGDVGGTDRLRFIPAWREGSPRKLPKGFYRDPIPLPATDLSAKDQPAQVSKHDLRRGPVPSPNPALAGVHFQPPQGVAQSQVRPNPSFTITPMGCTENTVQVIAPGENPSCPNGRIVFQSGGCMGSPSATLARELVDADGVLAQGAPFQRSPFPALTDGDTRCCDNLLLKLRGGVLLAIRQGPTWAEVSPKPVWWDKVRIADDGALRPHGTRIAEFVYRSTDCGSSWTLASVIDPIDPEIEGGKWAVPRPNEGACQTGHCWFGGWDRPDAYVDPWTGKIYVSTAAAAGNLDEDGMPVESRADNRPMLVFESSDSGNSWQLLFRIAPPAWIPLVMTSTPNGRLYFFCATAGHARLYYTNLADPPKFTGPKLVDFVDPGNPAQSIPASTSIPVPGGSDYDRLQRVPTPSLSPVSTDNESSRIQASYQWVDPETNRVATAVVGISVPEDGGDPEVTPLALIKATDPENTVLAATFVNPDPRAVTGEFGSTSMLYWVEGSTDPGVMAVVKYSLFEGEKGVTSPKTLGWFRPTDAGSANQADYNYSGSFLGTDGSLGLLAHWHQGQEGVRARILNLPSGPGPERFNAIWSRENGAHLAVWGLARDEFDAKAAELEGRGYRLIDLNAFVPPGAGGVRFNAVWRGGSENQQAVWSWARYDFEKMVAKLGIRGYRLERLNAFVLPNGQGERYNAIWSKQAGERRAVWRLPRADFDKKAAEMRKQGFQLLDLNAFVLPEGEEVYFNAVWDKGEEKRHAIWSWAREDFDRNAEKLKAAGYRLRRLNAFVLPKGQGERYNAVWSRGGEERREVWSRTRADFEKKAVEFGVLGYRLLDLNAFVLP